MAATGERAIYLVAVGSDDGGDTRIDVRGGVFERVAGAGFAEDLLKKLTSVLSNSSGTASRALGIGGTAGEDV